MAGNLMYYCAVPTAPELASVSHFSLKLGPSAERGLDSRTPPFAGVRHDDCLCDGSN